ncbi:MAG: hypothetical protein IH934_03925 [Nanoarchaeota archaeon]|nr:hypothetical protein [Nanoarchaeota archaeon]
MIESQTPYFRETEILTVLDMLETSPGVAVMGRFGAGKTTFMKEFFKYCQDQGISTSQRLYDGHEFTSPERAKSEGDDLVDELLIANDGRQRIMLVDSGDYFYLPKGETIGWERKMFGVDSSYSSPSYNEADRALGDPEKMESLVEKLAQLEYDGNEYIRRWEDRIHRGSLESNEKHQLNREIPSSPREYYKQNRKQGLERKIAISDQCARAMRELGYSMESGRVKAVLTYHTTFRYGKASDEAYQPDKGLGVTFDMFLAPHLVNFNLPEAYEPDKARSYLQIVKGLQNPEQIEQVLNITGGEHGVMKLAIRSPDENQSQRLLTLTRDELERMSPDELEKELSLVVNLVKKHSLNWE